LPVPPDESIGLDDEQCTLPPSEPTGQQHQEGSVRVAELRAADLPTEHDQLLAKKGILQNQLLLTATEFHQAASREA